VARRHATSESPPRHDPDAALARCLLVDQQRAVLLGVCGNQTAGRRFPGPRKPGIAASAESLAPSSRLSLADTVGLAHAGQRSRILAAAVIGRLRPLPLMGLAVGRELTVGANVEGARCPMLMAVGATLACVSNDGRRVVTIRLHLGVHSLGVAGPGAGGIRPGGRFTRRPREAWGRAVVSGSANGTCRNGGTLSGIERHSRYAECLLRRDEAESSGTGETPLSRLRA
jgi:hypothetical protein